jgi:hypothetical protein
MVLYAGILLIFGIKRTRYVGITALNLWLVGLIITAFFSIKFISDFRQKGLQTKQIELNATEDQPFRIDVNKDKNFENIFRNHDYFEIDEANMIITTDEEDIFYGIPQLYFRTSKTGDFSVEFVYRARGSSKPEAINRAELIQYNYTTQPGQMLLDPFYKLNEREVWRDQEVEIVVYVPVGQTIQLSKETRSIINNHKHSPYRLAGDTWVMTESGLEEVESMPAIMKEEIPKTIEEENPENPILEQKPVSVISFIYMRFIRVLG